MNDELAHFSTGLPIRLNTRDYGDPFGRRENPKERHQSIVCTPYSIPVDNQSNWSFCSPVSDSYSNEALYIYNESIPSESGKGGLCTKSKKFRRNVLILVAVICACVVMAGLVALATFLVTEKRISPGDIQTFSAIIKVNETFDSAMSKSDSEAFVNFGERFCSNVLPRVLQTFNDSRCRVDSLSPGSIIVNFTLELLSEKNVTETQSQLTELFNVSQVGLLTILPENNNISYTSPFSIEGFTLNSTKPFNYLQDSLPILPLNYTYPGYCGDYQVWSNGTFVLEKCPEGEEFAFLSPNDVSICAPPSSSTYCGRKRAENLTNKPEENHTTAVNTTSSSKPLPSTFSSSMMTTSSSTTYPIQNKETYIPTPNKPTTLKSPGQDNSTYFPSTTSTYVPSTTSTSVPSTTSTSVPSTTSASVPSTTSTSVPSTTSASVPSTTSTSVPSTTSTSVPSTTSTSVPSTTSTSVPSTTSTSVPSTTSTSVPSTTSTSVPSTTSTSVPSTTSTSVPSTTSASVLLTTTYVPSTTSTYVPFSTSTPGKSTTSFFNATVTASKTSEKYVSSPLSSSTTTLTTTKGWNPIYTCPEGEYAYLPTKDTYPDHCDWYQVCEPTKSSPMNCSAGTHFVYSNNPPLQKACTNIGDPSTFCSKMKEMQTSLP